MEELIKKIDAYIENFSHIFIDPVCLKSSGKSKIFDDVYKRPYQKFYMTTIDYIYHNLVQLLLIHNLSLIQLLAEIGLSISSS